MKIKKIYQIAVAILCVAACVLAACSPAAPGGESTTAGAGSTAAAGSTQSGSAATGAGNTTGSENPAAGGTRIQLTFGAETVYGTLDDNSVSRDLISRLPLTLTFSDFGGTEKIAYLPEGSAAWDTSDAPDSCTPSAGFIPCMKTVMTITARSVNPTGSCRSESLTTAEPKSLLR